MQAGEIIQVDFAPSGHAVDDVGKASKYSGDYLVTAVTHVMDLDKLTTTATITKDSLNTRTERERGLTIQEQLDAAGIDSGFT